MIQAYTFSMHVLEQQNQFCLKNCATLLVLLCPNSPNILPEFCFRATLLLLHVIYLCLIMKF